MDVFYEDADRLKLESNDTDSDERMRRKIVLLYMYEWHQSCKGRRPLVQRLPTFSWYMLPRSAVCHIYMYICSWRSACSAATIFDTAKKHPHFCNWKPVIMVLLCGIRPGDSRKYTAPITRCHQLCSKLCCCPGRCCAHLFHWCVKARFQAAVISATVQVYRTQLHTLYINGPSIAAGHCYPGQDDKNGHCSGSFCGCKSCAHAQCFFALPGL